MFTDSVRMTGHYKIEMFNEGEDAPFQVYEAYNKCCSGGLSLMLNLLGGLGGTAFNAANTYIGVGDASGSIVPASGDTDVTTNTTNKTYQQVSAAPTVTAGASGITITYLATFTISEANYAWTNLGLFNGNTPPASLMLSHVVGPGNSKTNTQVWYVTYQIAFS